MRQREVSIMDRKDFLKARIMEGMGKKSGTKPMSDKEKSLAALAHPKDKITHKDVLVGRGVLKKEEVESVEEMNKSGYSPGWMLKADPKLGKKVKDKIALAKLRQKAYGDPSAGKSVTTKEEVEQVNELKKSTMASYVKKAAASYGRDKQLIGRESPDGTVKNSRPEMKKAVKNRLAGINRAAERLAKEEVEQVNELKKGTLMSYVGKAREKNIKDSAKNRLAGTETSLSTIDKQQAKVSKRSKGIQRAYTRLNKEEVELEENYRVMEEGKEIIGTPHEPKGRDNVRAKKMPLPGKVEKIEGNKVYFRHKNGKLYTYYRRMEEEVEQVDEGNKENKAKKNTYVANIIKKKLSSQVLPSLKFGRRELKKEEVEQIDEAGALMRKLVPGLGRIQAASKAEKQRDLAKSFAREVPPKERGDTNPSDGYHHPNTSANRHWKRHWQFQKIATKQKPFQPLQQKEEVEQVDEASWTSATSMHGATRKQNRTNPPTHNIRKGDVVKTSDGKKGTVSFVDGDDIHVTGTNIYYPKKTEKHSASTLKKEEVDLDEAFINGREYASHGLMHPDHAKWQSHRVGVHTDFYAHGTGDKINGQVMKNDGKEVHIKATKSSGGKLHKFKVQSELPK